MTKNEAHQAYLKAKRNLDLVTIQEAIRLCGKDKPLQMTVKEDRVILLCSGEMYEIKSPLAVEELLHKVLSLLEIE